MNLFGIKPLLFISFIGALFMLGGCASDATSSSGQGQRDSLWAQRRSAQMEIAAPAADQYKQELAAVDEPADTNSVGLGYQPDRVESNLPPDPMMASEPEKAAPVEVTEPVVSVGDVGGENDIRSLPANYYTVQVIASDSVDRVYKFAAKHKLSVRYVVPTVREGVTWHVLLLDVYPTMAEAKAALDQVSPGLNTKPWIRKLGSVQSLMPAE